MTEKILGRFHVWVSNVFNPQSSDDFRPLDWATPVNFRYEVNGLGACTLKADGIYFDPMDRLQPPSEKLEEGKNLAFIWITDELKRKAENEEESEAKPIEAASNSSVFKLPEAPKDCMDDMIVWWGFVESATKEISEGAKDWRGEIQCLQIGHFLRGEEIRYPFSFQLGFNPVLDGINLQTASVRNKDYDIRRSYKESTGEKFDYWPNIEVLKFICKYASQTVKLDFSYPEEVLESHEYLNAFETWETFEGDSIMTALDKILNPLGWNFVFNSTEEITIEVIDRTLLKQKNKNEYKLIPEVSIFAINQEANVYDKVELYSNRVLIVQSASTYHPEGQFVGIQPEFYPEETDPSKNEGKSIKKYSNPLKGKTDSTNVIDIDSDINTMKASLDRYAIASTLDDINDKVDSQDSDEINQIAELNFQRVMGMVEAERQKYPSVYQHFYFAGCSGEKKTEEGPTQGDFDTSKPGPVLLTSKKPGAIDGNAPSNLIYAFPKLTIMNKAPTGKEGEKIDDHWMDFPAVLKGDHATPPIHEIQVEDFLPVPSDVLTGKSHDYIRTLDSNQRWEPFFWYRAPGAIVDYGTGGEHYSPLWLRSDSGAQGYQSYSVSFGWDGIKLKSPYPESLAFNSDDIFRDPKYKEDEAGVNITWSDVQDMGVYRTEWNYDEAGPSQRDPLRVAYPDKGHWKRMVFTFAARSDQRLNMYMQTKEKPTNVLRLYDDSIEYWMINPGTVYTTDRTYAVDNGEITSPKIMNTLKYEGKESFVRNDGPAHKKKLELLFEYHTKEKKAVRIENPITNSKGEGIAPILKIGDYITNVIDENTKIPVNSFVASIEYILEDHPRMIISTEYPAAPSGTRAKVRRKLNG